MAANVPLLVQAWGNVHRLAGGVLELLSIPTALARGGPQDLGPLPPGLSVMRHRPGLQDLTRRWSWAACVPPRCGRWTPKPQHLATRLDLEMGPLQVTGQTGHYSGPDPA